jgi:hypothetical protein
MSLIQTRKDKKMKLSEQFKADFVKVTKDLEDNILRIIALENKRKRFMFGVLGFKFLPEARDLVYFYKGTMSSSAASLSVRDGLIVLSWIDEDYDQFFYNIPDQLINDPDAFLVQYEKDLEAYNAAETEKFNQSQIQKQKGNN